MRGREAWNRYKDPPKGAGQKHEARNEQQMIVALENVLDPQLRLLACDATDSFCLWNLPLGGYRTQQFRIGFAVGPVERDDSREMD